jgi:hypothetical protein
MIFFIFGTRRSTRISPNENELLQGNVYCRMRGCGGRVHVIEANRHFHICFIPLCLLDTTNLVRCQRCSATITLPAHMGTRVSANQPNIPMAKGQLVHLPVVTPESIEMGIHDESRPILDKLEEGDAERPSVPENEKPQGPNHGVEETGTTIV